MTKKMADKTTGSFKYSFLSIQRIELIAGLILTFVAIFLHLIFMRQAGAFWRDEINSIALATMPSISDTWHCLNYDSFPILLSLILRLWTALFTDSELALRIFGFITGFSILCVLWLNGRLLGYRVPLLAIALFAINPLSIRTEDAIRPYGVGILLLLLTFGLIWKVVQDGRPWQIAAAAVLAILSVQCLYQNAFFLAVIIFASIIAAICKRQWKKIILLPAIGIAAAISLLPYYQIIKNTQDWTIILKTPVSFLNVWEGLLSALSSGGRFAYVLWVILTFIGVLIFFYSLRPQKNYNQNRFVLFLFCTIAMIICAATLLLFLISMQVQVRPWYFLPSMAVTAIFLDVVFSSFKLSNILRIVLAIIAVITTFNISKQDVCVRQTNIDIIASNLERLAEKDDLIIVNPWYFAISFQKYYHGKARFITIPQIEDYRIHRYDLLKAKIKMTNPIETVLSETSMCLKSGHCVWIAGRIEYMPGDTEPQPLAPAPNSNYGWNVFAYIANWETQFLYFVKSHNTKGRPLPSVTDKPVNPYEDGLIMSIRGW